ALASMVLMPALHDFYRTYPQVEIEMGAGNRQADLVSEGIDCAIRAGEVSEQFLVARRGGEVRFHTCGARGLIPLHRMPTAPRDVEALPTLGMTSSRTGRPLPFRFSNGTESMELSLSHRLVVNDTNAYVAAGTAGLGIIQAPTYAVHAAL